MSTSNDRGWMYKRIDSMGYLSLDFCNKLDEFLEFAYSNEAFIEKVPMDGGIDLRIKCPCSRCKNIPYRSKDDVRLHVMSKGFVRGYTTWEQHGETKVQFQHVGQSSNNLEEYDDDVDGYAQMVLDAMGPDNYNHTYNDTWEEQDPNPAAKGFYEMLQDADEPLYDGCQRWSKLEAASRLLSWKSECNVPDATYNKILPIIKDMLPDDEKLVGSFYETKKSLKKLSLPKIKIHACKNHCMLFHNDHDGLSNCLVCGESRYKSGRQTKVPNLVLTYMPIAPRLQRLFMSKKTAKEMTWHYDLEKYVKRMCEAYGPDVASQPLGDIHIWESIVGGRKKGRLEGCGGTSDPGYLVTGEASTSTLGSSSSTTGLTSSNEVHELQQKWQESNAKQKQLEKELEEMRAREAATQKKFAELQEMVVSHLGLSPPPPPV